MTYGYALETHSQVGFYRECLTHERRFLRMGLDSSQRFQLTPTSPTRYLSTTAQDMSSSSPPNRALHVNSEYREIQTLPPVNVAGRRVLGRDRSEVSVSNLQFSGQSFCFRFFPSRKQL
eukprot:TRINITY_DN4189_c0_g2_i1.p1 TRINITY_DN4189_c0_g2~~TRINITY_DN4189_c0_g2_i1.p1  ORF type:complete len:119 (+),score=12.51 TRINITY_DN4189_c0_g2_i1:286-642(+)